MLVKTIMCLWLCIGLYVVTPFASRAEAEPLDLEASLTTPTPTPAPHQPPVGRNLNIMGRVDLTYEGRNDHSEELKQNHFLLFLKIQASPKVSFMGEFVGQTFSYVDFNVSNKVKVTFGKVLVPFGDSQYFHRYYGGLQGYGSEGVMFPNIWAEPGLIYTRQSDYGALDIFWVNGISAANSTSDVDFQTSTNRRQAYGLRWSQNLFDNFRLILSHWNRYQFRRYCKGLCC